MDVVQCLTKRARGIRAEIGGDGSACAFQSIEGADFLCLRQAGGDTAGNEDTKRPGCLVGLQVFECFQFVLHRIQFPQSR